MAKVKSNSVSLYKTKPKKKGSAFKQRGPKATPTKPYNRQGRSLKLNEPGTFCNLGNTILFTGE